MYLYHLFKGMTHISSLTSAMFSPVAISSHSTKPFHGPILSSLLTFQCYYFRIAVTTIPNIDNLQETGCVWFRFAGGLI